MANEGYQICDNESLADLNVPLMILHDSQNWESSLDITEVVVPVPNIREVRALEDIMEIEEIEIHGTVEPVVDSTEDDLVTNDVQEQFDAFTIPWLKVPADITEISSFFQSDDIRTPTNSSKDISSHKTTGSLQRRTNISECFFAKRRRRCIIGPKSNLTFYKNGLKKKFFESST
jgi:hypothetical protein